MLDEEIIICDECGIDECTIQKYCVNEEWHKYHRTCDDCFKFICEEYTIKYMCCDMITYDKCTFFKRFCLICLLQSFALRQKASVIL
jgi:hypothetical protein